MRDSWRILRAFAWMRWRIFVNSLERTSARDTVERFSIAIDKLGPLLAGVMLIPSALGLFGLGVFAGYRMSAGEVPFAFALLRLGLFAALVLGVAGPLLLPAGDRTNPIRLLLLPIPARTLYVGQLAASLSDPWVLLAIPVLLSIPLGLAAGGAPGAALLGLAAGAGFLVVLAGLTSLATSVLHLVYRDRRRGELLALLFVVIVPTVAILPGLLTASQADRVERASRATREAREMRVTRWLTGAEPYLRVLLPSEQYAAAVMSASAGNVRRAAGPLAGLGLAGGLLVGAGLLLFGRLIGTPAVSGSRRGAAAASRELPLPGLSPAAAAIARAHLRLALRTPRGRSIVLSPLAVFLIFAVLLQRGESMDLGFLTLGSGLGLATLGAFICLMSILPIAVNQFAVDGAGLTLTLLAPVSDRDILTGKAVGNALVVAPTSLLCILVAYLLLPGGPAALWLTIPLGLAATYCLVSPLAATLSAVFPRAVDMNSIGRGSNAHGLAAVLGLGAFGLGGAPSLALVLVATRLFDAPWLAPLLVGAWLAAAAGAAWLLFIPARRVFATRRENLGLVV